MFSINQPQILEDFQMPTVSPPTASPLHFQNSLGVLAALKDQGWLLGHHDPSVSGLCLLILSFLKDVTGAGLRRRLDKLFA